MAEYLGITYEMMYQKPQYGVIEVATLFTRNGISRTRIFLFADQTDITENYDARMQKAIDNYIDDREREITAQEIVERLIKYFQTNTELTRAQAIAFMSDKILVDGAL